MVVVVVVESIRIHPDPNTPLSLFYLAPIILPRRSHLHTGLLGSLIGKDMCFRSARTQHPQPAFHTWAATHITFYVKHGAGGAYYRPGGLLLHWSIHRAISSSPPPPPPLLGAEPYNTASTIPPVTTATIRNSPDPGTRTTASLGGCGSQEKGRALG